MICIIHLGMPPQAARTTETQCSRVKSQSNGIKIEIQFDNNRVMTNNVPCCLIFRVVATLLRENESAILQETQSGNAISSMMQLANLNELCLQ